MQAGTTVGTGEDPSMRTITTGIETGQLTVMTHLVAGLALDLPCLHTVNPLVSLVNRDYLEVAVDNHERTLMRINERLKADISGSSQEIGRHNVTQFEFTANSIPARHGAP